MLNRETAIDSRQNELEQAYQAALRYALSYQRGWTELETARTRLKAFYAEQSALARPAA